MKRLYLLRHAKAAHDFAAGDDVRRPLTRRGREDAAAIGRFLNGQRRKPALVLCSSAVRTRETLEIVLEAMSARPDVQFLSELYLADEAAILSFVRHARDGAGTMMLVGHNPGLEASALGFCRLSEDPVLRERYLAMAEKFPTCALATVDFPIARWSDVAPGGGELRQFVTSKDLG